MTKLTAKKGMIKYKVGHGKEDFDYAFLEDLPCGEKTLKDVLKGIEDKSRQELKLEVEKKDLEIEILKNELAKLQNAFENTLKGLMMR